MSGIFVDEGDVFDVTVFYANNGKKIKVLEKEEKGCEKLTVTFRRPDFMLSQQIMGASIDITNDGPKMNLIKFRNSLVYFLANKWDAKDGEKVIELIPENIGKLKVEIVSILIKKVQEEVGDILFI